VIVETECIPGDNWTFADKVLYPEKRNHFYLSFCMAGMQNTTFYLHSPGMYKVGRPMAGRGNKMAAFVLSAVGFLSIPDFDLGHTSNAR